MLRTQGTSAPLRGEAAGETVALRAGWETHRGHVQLAGLQGEQLPKAQAGVAEKISGHDVVVRKTQVGTHSPSLRSVAKRVDCGATFMNHPSYERPSPASLPHQASARAARHRHNGVCCG